MIWVCDNLIWWVVLLIWVCDNLIWWWSNDCANGMLCQWSFVSSVGLLGDVNHVVVNGRHVAVYGHHAVVNGHHGASAVNAEAFP